MQLSCLSIAQRRKGNKKIKEEQNDMKGKQ
jgi:hypothetical protein